MCVCLSQLLSSHCRNDATKSGDWVDLLWSQLQSQQSENPQPGSKSWFLSAVGTCLYGSVNREPNVQYKTYINFSPNLGTNAIT